MLQMIDLVEDSGTGFAFPSQTLYMGKDKTMSEEKTREAERKVANGGKMMSYRAGVSPDVCPCH